MNNPIELIKPLPFKELSPKVTEKDKRVIFFDVSEVYSRIKINHYYRVQSIPITDMFPKVQGVCSCGCGQVLTGRQTRWASKDCTGFVLGVQGILCGYSAEYYLRRYYEQKCAVCGKETYDLDVDHIIPVKHGGGGCWLSNYQFLCHDCHVDKTNRDFGRGKYKPEPVIEKQSSQLTLF